MKPIFYYLSILLINLVHGLQAQNIQCGYDHLMQNSAYKKKMDSLNIKIAEITDRLQSERVAAKTAATIYTLPVVFHVLHHAGTPLGVGENIPDDLVLLRLKQLNEEYRKIPGSIGDGSGVDTYIEFCLASIDTNGNPTTGIDRINASVVSGFDDYGVGYYLYPDNTEQIKKLSAWDSTKYINIWFSDKVDSNKVEIGFGGVGFGIFADYDYGAAQLLAHEMGHVLSLLHTFQGGCSDTSCATMGDLVCDTPPTTSDATVNGNTCIPITPYPCGVRPLIENYMDYTIFTCKDMFTQGQADRMVACILASYPNMYTTANLAATGCNSNVPPQASFALNRTVTKVCTGDTVSFTDLSTRNPTGWNWTFENGTPATSVLQNPKVVFTQSGNNAVTLTVTNNSGTDSLSTFSDTISVTAAANPIATGGTGTSGSQVTLSASGTGTIYWYDSSGNFLQTGAQFTTPALIQTTTYYAQDVEQVASVSAGTALTDYYGLDSLGYMGFTVYRNIILDSISIYCFNNTPVSIVLRDKYSNIVDTALITNHTSYSLIQVPLGFHISADTGYALSLEPYNGVYAQLAVNIIRTQDPQYPFVTPGFVNVYVGDITHTQYSDSNYTDDNYIGGGANYYPYFFNWIVREDVCPSEKVAVTATITQSTTGVTSSLTNGFNVYPNPANSNVVVNFNALENGNLEMSDVNGRTVSTQAVAGGSASLNIEGIPSGIYFIHLTTPSGSYYTKLIKN